MVFGDQQEASSNYPAGGNAELVLWFALGRHCLGVPKPACLAAVSVML